MSPFLLTVDCHKHVPQVPECLACCIGLVGHAKSLAWHIWYVMSISRFQRKRAAGIPPSHRNGRIQALRTEEGMTPIFIVPEDEFDSYRAQPIERSKVSSKTGAEIDSESLAPKVQQWAMKLPFKPVRMSARAKSYTACCTSRYRPCKLSWHSSCQ